MSLEKRTKAFLDKTKANRHDIEVLGDYVGSNDKILVRGVECDHTWQTTPNNLRIGVGCPQCFNTRLSEKLTYSDQQFRDRVTAINQHYIPMSEYTKSMNMMTFRCDLHDHEWDMRAGHVKDDSCKICKLEAKQKEIAKHILSVNANIELLSDYINYSTLINWKCTIDNTEHFDKPITLKNGKARCSTCKKSSNDTVLIQQLMELLPTLELVDEFAGMNEHIFVRFTDSGGTWEDTPANILKNAKAGKYDQK